jgi:hypothetical protein
VAQAASEGHLDPSLLSGLPPEEQAAVFQAFRESFMSGFRLSLVVGGLVLLVAAIVANRFIPGRGAAREMHAARERELAQAAAVEL